MCSATICQYCIYSRYRICYWSTDRPNCLKFFLNDFLEIVSDLQAWAAGKYGRTVLELALRWVLDRGVDIALWGVRRPQQLDLIEKIWGWKLSPHDQEEIDKIVRSKTGLPFETEQVLNL